MGKLIYKNERERVGGQPVEDLRSGGSGLLAAFIDLKVPTSPFNQATGEKEAKQPKIRDLLIHGATDWPIR